MPLSSASRHSISALGPCATRTRPPRPSQATCTGSASGAALARSARHNADASPAYSNGHKAATVASVATS